MAENIKVGHDPEGNVVGIDTGDRQYAWLTDNILIIVAAIRACVAGDRMPAAAGGLVFARGDQVAITDEFPQGIIRGSAGNWRLMGKVEWSFGMTKPAALKLADELEEIYRKLRPGEKPEMS
jgi:hypothetical protein